METIRSLHAHALADAGRAVAAVRPAAEDRPSRCAGWTVRDLVEHMVGQNLGFAAAIATGDAPLDAYAPRPVADWAGSVAALTRAVAEPAPEIRLAEVRPQDLLPVDTVLAMHALDSAVHAWDLTGPAYRPSDDLVELVLGLAERIPARRAPDGAFAAVVDEPGEGLADDPWHRALRLLGRRPGTAT